MAILKPAYFKTKCPILSLKVHVLLVTVIDGNITVIVIGNNYDVMYPIPD